MAAKAYYVYMMANAWRTLYAGVTNDLQRRVTEHKLGAVPGFTSRYGLTHLVYYEVTSEVRAAIQREKEIKGWRRERKVPLGEARNPEWSDLAAEWQ